MTNPCWLALASRCFAVSFVAALLGACRRPADERGPAADAAPQARLAPIGAASEAGRDAELDPTRTTAPARDAGAFPAATRRACRVMALRGTATSRPRVEGSATPPGGGSFGSADAQPPASLAQNDLLPEGGLIELAAGAELTLQATVSTREITLVGPGLAEACLGGEEAVRLSHGKVSAFPGGGVRPGAEVWVATPLGVVRFNDAKIDVAVPGRDAARIEVALATGHATFVPAPGVEEMPGRSDAGRAAPAPPARANHGAIDAEAAGEEVKLVQGVGFAARRPTGPLPRWVRELVGACVRLAAEAREAGRLVGSPPTGPRSSLGDLAFAHVRARQRARAACETAWAAGALAPGLLDARLRADLEGVHGGGLP